MADESRGEERDSEHDAMGNEKRRQVIGRQYGATVRKRLLVYGAFVVVVVVSIIVFVTVVIGYDNRDIKLEDTAPWTQTDAAQTQPRDVDFKANGPRSCPQPCSSDITMPEDQILNR